MNYEINLYMDIVLQKMQSHNLTIYFYIKMQKVLHRSDKFCYVT